LNKEIIMNDLNPNAILLWIFFSAVGYLIGGTTGALIGLAVITGVQIAIAAVS
jgi:hypothetical protein